jgi:hypothetical protein
LKIDIWKDGHTAGIIARAVPADMAGRSIRIIEPHDLIAMKLRGGRLKDDYDIGEIAASNAIDRQAIEMLVGPELLRRFDDIRRRS